MVRLSVEPSGRKRLIFLPEGPMGPAGPGGPATTSGVVCAPVEEIMFKHTMY